MHNITQPNTTHYNVTRPGVEFESLPGLSHGQTAGAVAKACHDRDLLVLPCGPYDTLRFIPPLNISTQELTDGMDIFRDAVESVVKA